MHAAALCNVTPGTAFLIEMTNKGESRFNHELEWANIKYVTISDTLTSYNLRMHQKRNKQCDKNKGPKISEVIFVGINFS